MATPSDLDTSADSEEPPAPAPSGSDLSLSALAARVGTVEARLDRLRREVGRAPDPTADPPVPGHGLRAQMARVLARVEAMDTRLAMHFAAIEEASARRTAAIIWAAKIVGGALLLAAVAWALSALPRVRLVQRAEQGPALPAEVYQVARRRS